MSKLSANLPIAITEDRKVKPMPDCTFISKPAEIENRSFEIISRLLEDRITQPSHEPVIKRVIHTTADLDYGDILSISENAIIKGLQALKASCGIVTTVSAG
jgi:precorrin-8X/cobalt-precorrin-8 methylmutase